MVEIAIWTRAPGIATRQETKGKRRYESSSQGEDQVEVVEHHPSPWNQTGCRPVLCNQRTCLI
jgi:hypothetical protein